MNRKLLSILIIELVLILILFSSLFTYYKNGKNVARAFSNFIIKHEKSEPGTYAKYQINNINNKVGSKITDKFVKNTVFLQKDVTNLDILISFYNIDFVNKEFKSLGLNNDLTINKKFFRDDKFLNIFKKYSVKFEKIYDIENKIIGILKVSSDNKKIFFSSFYKAFIEFIISSLIVIFLIIYAWDKFIGIIRKWTSVIFSNSEEGKHIYFLIILLLPLLLFFPQLIKNWYIYYFLIIFYIFLIPYIDFNAKITKSLILISVLILFLAIFHEIFINFGYIGTRMDYPILKRLALILVAIAGVSIYLRGINLEKRFLTITILIVSLSFIEFRAATVLTSIYGAFLFLVFVYILEYKFFRFDKNFKYQTFFNYLILITTAYFAVIFAFRTDWLFFAEKGFHASYYVAPIISLENGYKLLSDQPSQYGFLNILIPYLININNPLNSFHIFQSSSLVAVIILSYFIFARLLKCNYFSIIILIFSILLLLSDPKLIGPNAYPSCSVTRFFPVYLFLFLNIYSFTKNFKSNTHLIMNSLIACFALFWSAEAFYYVLFPILYQFGNDIFLNFKKSGNLKIELYKLIKLFSLLILFFTLSILLYKYFFDIKNINLSLLFIHTIGYGKGYAVMPIDPLSPMFLILVPAVYVVSNIRKNIEAFKRYNFYIGIILALITYYVARAVPNNLNALWPLIFLIFTVAYFDIKKLNVDKKILKFILLPAILISSLSLSNLALNFLKTTNGYEAQNGIKSTNFYTNHFDSSYDFNLPIKHKKIENILIKITKEPINLSILTAGVLNNNLIKSGNIKPFVQSPIMLLAKPLSPMQIEKIIKSSTNFKAKEGFILHDSKWDHFDDLLKYIVEIKTCDVITSDQRFKLYKCINRKD